MLTKSMNDTIKPSVVEVDVQFAVNESSNLPTTDQIESWVFAACSACAGLLNNGKGSVEVSVRLVNQVEMSDLNQRFRNKSGSTNVLSFSSELNQDVLDSLAVRPLGDIVVCHDTVQREAVEQAKPIYDHYAHMLVHGVLHLLGFDHQQAQEADLMEATETSVLQSLGVPNPYQDTLH